MFLLYSDTNPVRRNNQVSQNVLCVLLMAFYSMIIPVNKRDGLMSRRMDERLSVYLCFWLGLYKVNLHMQSVDVGLGLCTK